MEALYRWLNAQKKNAEELLNCYCTKTTSGIFEQASLGSVDNDFG